MTWTVGLAAWLVVLVAAALAIWRTLPDRVPTHIGPSGPDRWGSPREWLISTLIGLGIMLILGPGLTLLIPRLPMSVTNLPHPEYWKTPERYPVAVRHTQVFVLQVMAAASLLPAVAIYGAWVMREGGDFPNALMYAALAVLAVQLVWGIVRMFRALRPADDLAEAAR